MKYIAFALTFIFIGNICIAQSVTLLTQGAKSSLRGLSVVNDQTVWVSGSSGMVARSIDGGLSWTWMQVKGFEKNDFRDIEAFDSNTALIMAIDSPAYILRTTNGGLNWKVVFENHHSGIFLDAMDFDKSGNGIVLGDPLDGRFFEAATSNHGNSWEVLPISDRPLADSGEACFASSGTNIRMIKNNKTVFVSGGTSAHLFKRNNKKITPLIQGSTSTGANSIAIKKNKKFILVGGDFENKEATTGNCAITENNGKSWHFPKVTPQGYRSCIEYLGNKKWITCGLTGVDISIDDGNSFSNISTTGFNVCRKAKIGNTVFMAGGGGRIGKIKD